MALTACANMSTMSPAEQAVERSKRRFIATTAEGAVGGALLGAALGALAGGGRGAAIGAAAGAVAGGVAGAAVAQNNFRQSQTEGNLNAAIADANEQAGLARQDAASGQTIAAEARARSASLRAQLRSGQINAAQYRAGLASYARDLATLREMSRGFDEQIQSMRANASLAGSRGALLNASATDISGSKQRLDRAIDDLYATTSAEPS